MLVLFLCLTGIVFSTTLHRENVNGVVFGRMEPAGLLDDEESQNYRHIEPDLAHPDYLLYIENNSIKTVSQSTWAPHLVAGGAEDGYLEGQGNQAKFSGPFRVYQPNSSTIIVADTGNFCLRAISRDTNQTRTFAGKCTELGSQSGALSFARFSSVLDIVKLPDIFGNKIVITDFDPNNRLCTIDLVTENVTTYVNLYVTPIALALHPAEYSLFFSFEGGLGTYNINSQTLSYLTQTSYKSFGHVDGQLGTAMFSASLLSLTFMTPDILLVADHLNNVIRVVNLKGDSVSTICKSVDSYFFPAAGNVTHCTLLGPQAIYIQPSRQRILIGGSLSLGLMYFSEADDSGDGTIVNRPTVMTATTPAATSKPVTSNPKPLSMSVVTTTLTDGTSSTKSATQSEPTIMTSQLTGLKAETAAQGLIPIIGGTGGTSLVLIITLCGVIVWYKIKASRRAAENQQRRSIELATISSDRTSGQTHYSDIYEGTEFETESPPCNQPDHQATTNQLEIHNPDQPSMTYRPIPDLSVQPATYITNAHHISQNRSGPMQVSQLIRPYPSNGSTGSSTPQIRQVYFVRQMQVAEELRFVSGSDITSFSATQGYDYTQGNRGINLQSVGHPLQGQGQIEYIDMETGLPFDAGAIHQNVNRSAGSNSYDNRLIDATPPSGGPIYDPVYESSNNNQQENCD